MPVCLLVSIALATHGRELCIDTRFTCDAVNRNDPTVASGASLLVSQEHTTEEAGSNISMTQYVFRIVLHAWQFDRTDCEYQKNPKEARVSAAQVLQPSSFNSYSRCHTIPPQLPSHRKFFFSILQSGLHT